MKIARQVLFTLLVFLGSMHLALGAAPPNAPVSDTGTMSLSLTGQSLSSTSHAEVSEGVRIIVIMTLLSILPALVLSMTAFIRIIIVMSMVRHAFGMPETPPNQVLIALALFLTAFVMLPTFQTANDEGIQPLLQGKVSITEGFDRASAPMRDFMLRQVRQKDLALMYEMSHKPVASSAADVSLFQLIPAFILNELRVSFQIGFVIMLPFLLIDLVVSSVLLSLGMLMVPPSTISLPLKVLMFVLIDGWTLVLQGVLASFH